MSHELLKAQKHFWSLSANKKDLFSPLALQLFETEPQFERMAESCRKKLKALRGDKSRPPKISVVITAYNEEPSIPVVLTSLGMSVNAPSTEVLVINNASLDRTAQIAESFGARVIDHNIKGYSKARRAGILMSEGELVMHTDADCYCSPHLLMILSEFFNKNQRIEACFAPESYISEKGPSAQVFMYNHAKEITHTILSLLSYKHEKGNGRNFTARKSAFMKIGGGFNPQIGLASDLDTALQFIKRGTMAVIEDKDAFVLSNARRLEEVGFLTIALQRLFKTDLPFILGGDFTRKKLEDVREKVYF
jgi:glycosyltransferase involved in cell wall biosynthesis